MQNCVVKVRERIGEYEFDVVFVMKRNDDCDLEKELDVIMDSFRSGATKWDDEDVYESGDIIYWVISMETISKADYDVLRKHVASL